VSSAEYPLHEELDAPFTWKEFSNAVNGLKNCKAPGLNGVPPEASKAMDSADSIRLSYAVL
jgi:hypothetical protein